MKKALLSCAVLAVAGALLLATPGVSQTGPAPALPSSGDAVPYTDYSKWSDAALNQELGKRALVEKKVLVKMRDGVGLSTDVYRPKDATGPVPTVFIRTPYNMQTLAGGSLRQVLEGVDRGYAVIYQNERGRYFSEGDFEILGHPRTDGYDALTWIADQSWSNKKVGTFGCSSTAEWQLQLAATNHPAHAAMVPMASGAGIGRVGEFHEQGNWYRGGVPRTLFSIWLYGVDNPLRAQIPEGLDAKTRQYISQYSDLNPKKPDVTWNKQVWHLPYAELLTSLGEPAGTNEKLIARALPDDPEWYKGGLYHDNESWGVPALWYNSWYDVSIGPNLALYNHATKTGVDAETRDNQYAIVGPSVHCAYASLGPNFKSGTRELGDASMDVNGEVWKFFDRFLKGDADRFPGRRRRSATSPWATMHGRPRASGRRRAWSRRSSICVPMARRTRCSAMASCRSRRHPGANLRTALSTIRKIRCRRLAAATAAMAALSCRARSTSGRWKCAMTCWSIRPTC